MSEPIIDTNAELERVISRIQFVNSVLDFKWRFCYKSVTITDDDGPRKGWLVWVTFERPDIRTGKIGRGRGRDEIVWAGTSLSGVVKTCWLLVELMIRHELMEGFRYDNAIIFNPHNTVTDLAAVQKSHEDRLGGV